MGAEGDCILDGLVLRVAGGEKGYAQGSPLELDPETAVEAIEMRVVGIAGGQVNAGLNAVEELVGHEALAREGVGRKGPEDHGPVGSGPLHGGVGYGEVFGQGADEDAVVCVES